LVRAVLSRRSLLFTPVRSGIESEDVFAIAWPLQHLGMAQRTPRTSAIRSRRDRKDSEIVIELMAPVFAPVATALGFITVGGLPAVFCTFANTARAKAESTAMIALRI
jgi:hypothetical protein